MSKSLNAKSTNANDEVMAFFTKNAVEKVRAKGSDDGGRYNPKTRRLTLPSRFAGKKCRFAHETGTNLCLIQIADDGKFACHPAQHFITVPTGTFAVSKSATFKRIYRLSVTATLEKDGDIVAYEVPVAKA